MNTVHFPSCYDLQTVIREIHKPHARTDYEAHKAAHQALHQRLPDELTPRLSRRIDKACNYLNKQVRPFALDIAPTTVDEIRPFGQVALGSHYDGIDGAINPLCHLVNILFKSIDIFKNARALLETVQTAASAYLAARSFDLICDILSLITSAYGLSIAIAVLAGAGTPLLISTSGFVLIGLILILIAIETAKDGQETIELKKELTKLNQVLNENKDISKDALIVYLKRVLKKIQAMESRDIKNMNTQKKGLYPTLELLQKLEKEDLAKLYTEKGLDHLLSAINDLTDIKEAQVDAALLSATTKLKAAQQEMKNQLLIKKTQCIARLFLTAAIIGLEAFPAVFLLWQGLFAITGLAFLVISIHNTINLRRSLKEEQIREEGLELKEFPLKIT